jgi:hypothetical protein
MGLSPKDLNHLNTIEVIDLNSPPKSCKNLPDFPLKVADALGGLGFKDRPKMCGGYNWNVNNNNCYNLEKNEWITASSMNLKRSSTSFSSSPYPHKLFVAGGIDTDALSYLSSAEVLTEHGWEILSETLPVNISNHCSVLVNSTTVMIVAGRQHNPEYSVQTFFLNTVNNVWVDGPALKNLRAPAGCGRIRKDSQSQEFSTIVVGGYNGTSTLSSVELLDDGAKNWRDGPEFPYEIESARMVEDPNGGVIIVGPLTTGTISSDELFQLRHANSEWTKMEQKLQTRRLSFTTFLVPDDVVECV